METEWNLFNSPHTYTLKRFIVSFLWHCFRNIDDEKVAMKAKAEEGGDTVVGNYATYDQVLITDVGLSPLKQLL